MVLLTLLLVFLQLSFVYMYIFSLFFLFFAIDIFILLGKLLSFSILMLHQIEIHNIWRNKSGCYWELESRGFMWFVRNFFYSAFHSCIQSWLKEKKKQYNRLCPGMSEASAVFLFYLFFAYFLFSFLLQGCRCLISFLMIVMAWVDADVRPEFHS